MVGLQQSPNRPQMPQKRLRTPRLVLQLRPPSKRKRLLQPRLFKLPNRLRL